MSIWEVHIDFVSRMESYLSRLGSCHSWGVIFDQGSENFSSPGAAWFFILVESLSRVSPDAVS